MIRHHTRLTRLARQAMRRGDAAEATRWMRAAALVRPAAAKAKAPASVDVDNQIDPYAAERQRAKEQLERLLVRLDHEAAEHEQQAARNDAKANSC